MTSEPVRSHPVRRWLGRLVIVMLLLVGGELVARFGLGLGDPPLMIIDEQMEYRFKPGVYHRFGNRIEYNVFSMRSDPVTRIKADPRQRRVLVIGDSIINGGNQTDQSELATTLLQKRLGEQGDRPVWVGNVSAGSWGPQNMLEYVKKFGWFEADDIIIVVNSPDATDRMTFSSPVGRHPNLPTRAPLLALEEGVIRYLPRYLPWAEPAPQAQSPQSHRDESVLAALRELLDQAKANGSTVTVVHYALPQECSGDYQSGYSDLKAVAQEAGVTFVETRPDFQRAIEAGEQPLRDFLHPSQSGQRILLDIFLRVLSLASDASPSDGPV